MPIDKFFVSSFASSKNRINDAIAELVELGFLNIELSGGTIFYDGITKDLLDLKKKYKINFIIHGYFPPPRKNFMMNISSRNKEERESSFLLVKEAIGLTKLLGSDLYTIHSGYNEPVREIGGKFYKSARLEDGWDRQATKKDFYEAIDLLLEQTVHQGVKVGIENLFPLDGAHSFLESGEDIFEFLDRYGSVRNLGLLLDMGHLNVASNTLGFDKFSVIDKLFANYSKKIFEIHISENNGSHDYHGISEIESWQIEVLIGNKRVLRDMPMVFEWHNSACQEVYRRFKELKGMLN